MIDLLYRYLPVIAVLIVFGERMREVFAKRQTVPGKTVEKLTFNLFMLCGVLIVIGGIAEYFVLDLRLWWPTFATGVVFSVASFVVRRSAIRALGRFWSLHVEMREGHEFVTTGPFAHARHPVYSSMILELLGIGLILNAWFALAGVFAIFIPTLIARLRIEEAALVEKFGDAYREYMRRTPAIVPGARGRGAG
jgi:protein-S-isoprenylcysteine O-methyltransferase Ste14